VNAIVQDTSLLPVAPTVLSTRQIEITPTEETTPLPAEQSDILTIEFGGGDFYSVDIIGDQVVGGYAQGSTYWSVEGGQFDGTNLQVLFISPERSGCGKWVTHFFEVRDEDVLLRTSVDRCGEAIIERNVAIPRHK